MKIAVIGTGKMGSWFAREFSRRNIVAVYDRDTKSMSQVEGAVLLRCLAELKTFNPELVLNCVSLRKTIDVFKDMEPHVSRDCILSDITSIKGEIPNYYQSSNFRFASFHPMFGPQFANLEELKDENVILIQESDRRAKEFLRNFFQDFHCRIFEYSFAEHDELMSYSLTLPFASSIVFSACLRKGNVPGTTFSRHTEIARKLFQEDSDLLSEVLFNPHSLRQLDIICSKLEFLKHVIRARDYEEALKFLDRLRHNLQSIEE